MAGGTGFEWDDAISIYLINTQTGAIINRIKNLKGIVQDLEFSPDGKWLAATGSPAGEVRIHEVATSQRKATLRGHAGLVFGLSFSPDGTRLATAGYEGTVRIFDWAKEQRVAQFVPVPIVAAASAK